MSGFESSGMEVPVIEKQDDTKALAQQLLEGVTPETVDAFAVQVNDMENQGSQVTQEAISNNPDTVASLKRKAQIALGLLVAITGVTAETLTIKYGFSAQGALAEGLALVASAVAIPLPTLIGSLSMILPDKKKQSA